MSLYSNLVWEAVQAEDGVSLASLFDLKSIHKSSKVPGPFGLLAVEHFKARHAQKTNDLQLALECQTNAVNQCNAIFAQSTKWILPLLFILNKQLLELSMDVGEDATKDCCRIMNKSFSLCLTDRFSSLPDSRKWG